MFWVNSSTGPVCVNAAQICCFYEEEITLGSNPGKVTVIELTNRRGLYVKESLEQIVDYVKACSVPT